MKKILILANNDVGLYKFRKELIQQLLTNNYTVYISLPYGEYVDNLKKMGCIFINTPIDRRKINPFKDIKILYRYLCMIKKIKPDKIITYTIKPNIYGGLVSSVLRKDYAVNITGLGSAFQTENLLKKLIVFLYKIGCKKAKTVFFENSHNYEVFLDSKIVTAEKSVILNGAGVNTDEYPLTEYPEKAQTTNFLFVGRIMKEKGIEELFEAARRIKKDNLPCSISIVGPCEEEYIPVLEKLECDGIIGYFGAQKDVVPFYQNCHCFVLPSYHEGMANTLLEASAIGRPSITSDIPGCRESVLNRKSGLLCKPKDSDDLYEKMICFYNIDMNERINMGNAARKHIVDKFDKKAIVKKTLEALKIE